MAIICSNVYSSKRFCYDRSDKKFSAFASDIGHARLFCQIYDDAADRGFAIRNHQTGNTVVFYLSNTATDREGDIRFWELKVIAEHARKFNLPEDLSVIVFND